MPFSRRKRFGVLRYFMVTLISFKKMYSFKIYILWEVVNNISDKVKDGLWGIVPVAPQKYLRTLTLQNERWMTQSIRQNGMKFYNLSWWGRLKEWIRGGYVLVNRKIRIIGFYSQVSCWLSFCDLHYTDLVTSKFARYARSRQENYKDNLLKV